MPNRFLQKPQKIRLVAMSLSCVNLRICTIRPPPPRNPCALRNDVPNLNSVQHPLTELFRHRVHVYCIPHGINRPIQHNNAMPREVNISDKKFQSKLFKNILNFTYKLIASKILSPYFKPFKEHRNRFSGWHTVTRLDVIFSYPDRVPLTHFVHRAKKAFAMRAWIFCWVLCATGIFRRCNGKVIKHRVGANLRLSDYGPSVLPLRHCNLVCKVQGHSFSSFAGIFRPFL